MKNNSLNHLLTKSTALFKKYGVKNMTMDDVASELGISKKTIYKFVDNKAQLVEAALQNYLDSEKKQLKAIVAPTENSVDEMISMILYFFQQAHNFNPSVLTDMQKYYPKAWGIYSDYRYKFMLKVIEENLLKGVEQGVYRKNLNADIIARIYIGGIDILINQDLFPIKKYVYLDIYKEYIDYHLRGIVSEKGLKYLERHNLFKR